VRLRAWRRFYETYPCLDSGFYIRNADEPGRQRSRSVDDGGKRPEEHPEFGRRNPHILRECDLFAPQVDLHN
jgi:hypothetical protein